MTKIIDILEPVYFTNYEIVSSLNYQDNSRYCTTIEGKIKVQGKTEDDEQVLIGKLVAYKLLLDIVPEGTYSPMNIFDVKGDVFAIGEEIYDFEEKDWKQVIYKHFDHDLLGSNLLILDTVQILPDYRGRGLGARFIKDFYNNFHHGCGLVVLQVYSTQNGITGNIEEGSWNHQMKYELFKDKSAEFKLFNYFKNMGFEPIPAISKELMFLNPDKENHQLDLIKLDD